MGALGGLLQGMVAGRQLRMQMKREALQNQLTQKELARQSQNDAMNMLKTHMDLQMMGARPLDPNGMVDEMLSTQTPQQSSSAPSSSPAPSSSSVMGDMLGTTPGTGGPAIADKAPVAQGGMPVPTAMGAPPVPAMPDVANVAPNATGTIKRKANKGQTVTVPWANGESQQYELPTAQEQLQRQAQLAQAAQLREKMGLEQANQYVLQAFGVPVSDRDADTLGLPRGFKVTRAEAPGIAEKAAQARKANLMEVPAGGAVINTTQVSGGGQPGGAAPAGGSTAGGAPGGAMTPAFQNPPLEDPQTRFARSYAAELLGKNPRDVSAEDVVKAKGDVALLSMNPLERKVKEGELQLQPLTAAEKRSTMATQALQRQLHSQELDLAGDEDTVNMAASKFLQTGQMPALGMSSTLLRGKIMGRAAQMAKEKGISPEQVPALQDSFKALSKSLDDLQKRQGQILAFEKGGAANLDNFIQLAQKQVDSGSPLVNRALRGGARTITGSPDQAAADAARVAAFNEISKILSGSLGNAGVSDSGRKEAEDLLRRDYTMRQLLNVAKVLRNDMQNRSAAYGNQIQSVRQQMQDLTKPNAEVSATTQATGGAAPKKGDKQSYQGHDYTFDGTQWVRQ